MDIMKKLERAAEIAAQMKALTAEAEALFGGGPSSLDAAPVDVDPPSDILPAPPYVAPVVMELAASTGEAPKKRGRPLGSTNKPKPVETPITATPTETPAPPVNDDIPWGGDDEGETNEVPPAADNNEDVF